MKCEPSLLHVGKRNRLLNPGTWLKDHDLGPGFTVDSHNLSLEPPSMRRTQHVCPLTNEPAPANFAYWGISQDNYGKNYYVNAAQDYGPVSYETPIIYGGSGDRGVNSAACSNFARASLRSLPSPRLVPRIRLR